LGAGPACRDDKRKGKGKSKKAEVDQQASGHGLAKGAKRPHFFLFTFYFFLLTAPHHKTSSRFQTLQKPHRFVMIELRILRFDHQKKLSRVASAKFGTLENRMVRAAAACSAQHPRPGERRHQNRAFKRDRMNRPLLNGLRADIDGIVDSPPSSTAEKSAHAPMISASKKSAQTRARKADRFPTILHRNGE